MILPTFGPLRLRRLTNNFNQYVTLLRNFIFTKSINDTKEHPRLISFDSIYHQTEIKNHLNSQLAKLSIFSRISVKDHRFIESLKVLSYSSEDAAFSSFEWVWPSPSYHLSMQSQSLGDLLDLLSTTLLAIWHDQTQMFEEQQPKKKGPY